MPRFNDALARANRLNRPLILDGAVGTELDNRGADTASPAWSGTAPLNHPELLQSIHSEYVAAGAEVITACTFRTTRRAFENAGIDSPQLWKEAANAAVAIAKAAASPSALVAGSIGPLEDCFVPGRAPTGQEAMGAHRELIQILVDADVDVLWFETFGTLGELEAALRAAQEVEAVGVGDNIPRTVSVTTDRFGALISGEPLAEAVSLAARFKAAAFLVNCIPVAHVDAALPQLKNASSLPVGAYANLGFAEATQDWSGSAHLSPAAYASRATSWGLDLIGACCGSTPDHIRAMRDRILP